MKTYLIFKSDLFNIITYTTGNLNQIMGILTQVKTQPVLLENGDIQFYNYLFPEKTHVIKPGQTIRYTLFSNYPMQPPLPPYVLREEWLKELEKTSISISLNL